MAQPIEECSERELLDRLEQRAASEAVFVYTPFCGTCQLAERMLSIALEAGADVAIRKLNINYAPRLRERWAITSVPCLVLIRSGEPVGFEYAMRAVDHLYARLKTLASPE